jgi:hypothetical protein
VTIMIIKTARDQGLYLLWDMDEERPTFVGAREDVRQALDQPVRGQVWPYEHEIEAWLQQADSEGSSSGPHRNATIYGWHGAGPAYRSWGRIPRGRLHEYAKRIFDADEWYDDPGDLLVPFEHLDVVDRTPYEEV